MITIHINLDDEIEHEITWSPDTVTLDGIKAVIRAIESKLCDHYGFGRLPIDARFDVTRQQ